MSEDSKSTISVENSRRNSHNNVIASLNNKWRSFNPNNKFLKHYLREYGKDYIKKTLSAYQLFINFLSTLLNILNRYKRILKCIY